MSSLTIRSILILRAITNCFLYFPAWDQIREARIVPSSFGGGYALAFAQKLFGEGNPSVSVDGLILMMPCINDHSVRGAIPLLKRMPQLFAKGVLDLGYKTKSLIGKIVGDNFETGGTTEAKYQRLMSIPNCSKTAINPAVPVHLFLSKNDLLIDNERVVRDMGKIANPKRLFVHKVCPTGVNNHDFRPEEWMETGKTLILPLLMKTWQ